MDKEFGVISAAKVSAKWTIPDLSGFVFRIADIATEEAKILNCRWKGYRKYGFPYPGDCRDGYDDYAVHYVCERGGKVVGCLRMVPARKGKFELQEFVDLSAWLEREESSAELTRFSIPVQRRLRDIKFGLWKLAWLNAVGTGHTHFIIASAQETFSMYQSLGFECFLGRQTFFSHSKLKNRKHVIMTLDIVHAEDLYRRAYPHLYHFFYEIKHSNIIKGSL